MPKKFYRIDSWHQNWQLHYSQFYSFVNMLALFLSWITFNLKKLLLGWVYPVVSHWAWDTNSPGWLNELGFHDFAGSGVVHLTGGMCALVSCIIIGPRKGRFDSEGKPTDMPGHSVPLAALGGGILLVCFLAFNGGSQARTIIAKYLGPPR